MDVVEVFLGERSYPIYIDNSFDSLSEMFERHVKSKKVLIITDSNVDKIYCDGVIKALGKSESEIFKYSIAPGEKSKTIDTVYDIYRNCIEFKLDRSSCIIAVGGGVVGDIAGFAASTYIRGINLVHVPSSLIAQVDSSIGGKTGIDFIGYKNMIGTFYQPKMVFINVSTLRTLPKREFVSGMGEVLKYGLIADKGLFNYFRENVNKLLEERLESSVIKRCCQIKADIVSKDESDKNLRAILNFGHTMGHVIESASGFKYLHGEAVALGIIGASHISKELGYLRNDEYANIKDIIGLYNLPVTAEGISYSEVLNIIFKDKKNIGGSLNFVILSQIGNAKIISNVDKRLIQKAFGEIGIK